MPVKIKKKGSRFQVSTPGGVKAFGTTYEKAQSQSRLLNAIEHGWKPTGKPAKARKKKKRKGKSKATMPRSEMMMGGM